MKYHVLREESGSCAPGVPGCPSVLRAWFCFCSALKFTKCGLQDEPAGICGIWLQFQALCFPTAGSSKPRTLLDVHSHILGRERKSCQALQVKIGFSAATRRGFPLLLPSVVCKRLLSPESTGCELQGQPERLWELCRAPQLLCAYVQTEHQGISGREACNYKQLWFRELEPCLSAEKQRGPWGPAFICVTLGWIWGGRRKGRINQQQIILKAGFWLAVLNCHIVVI